MQVSDKQEVGLDFRRDILNAVAEVCRNYWVTTHGTQFKGTESVLLEFPQSLNAALITQSAYDIGSLSQLCNYLLSK